MRILLAALLAASAIHAQTTGKVHTPDVDLALLTDSTTPKSDRDALFVDLARETAAALHPVAR